LKVLFSFVVEVNDDVQGDGLAMTIWDLDLTNTDTILKTCWSKHGTLNKSQLQKNRPPVSKGFTMLHLDLKYFTNTDAILHTHWIGHLEL